jgi:hypothetical protein
MRLLNVILKNINASSQEARKFDTFKIDSPY